MLLPDTVRPQNSIYYIGALVLKALQDNGTMTIANLYVFMKENHNISFPVLLLSLDWLYLINIAIINKNGDVSLCS